MSYDKEMPLGNDAMVATPTGQGLSNKLDLAAKAREAGLSTHSEQDVALLKARVESQVKQMIASGASDAQIQQAVAGLAHNPELAGIAKDMAQQQLDAEKFNLFSSRGGLAVADVSQAVLGEMAAPSVPDARDKSLLATLVGRLV